ncbi:hypothetical protein L1049_008485 [Liquidambar formosana]|uniref:C2H2-type domain-containing protein n=1 Tax=Liquidambar formosana TaxID=63359 RepID=A0AAP0X8B2_LIQFO
MGEEFVIIRVSVIKILPSPNSSVEFTKSTEEEEDMANCLILLAKGQTPKSSEPAKAAAATGQGLYVYQCKTCNRCFSSFQALGGHRASHKKPKAAAVIEEKKVVAFVEEEEEDLFNNSTNTTLSLQIVNRASSCNTKKSNKVHECSVCGAEFLSGQALGGHMRRHRTFVSTPTMATSSADSQEAKKPRHMLSLDLNLPATDDDFRESKFPFSASKEQALVFSPLVDCYY